MQNAGWDNVAKMSKTIMRRRELDDKVCDTTSKIQQNIQHLLEEYYKEDTDARRIEILTTFDKINTLAENLLKIREQNLQVPADSTSNGAIPILEALDLVRVNSSTLQLNATTTTKGANTPTNNNTINIEKAMSTERKRLKTSHTLEDKPKSLLKESALKNTCVVKIDVLSKEQIEKWMKEGQKEETNKSFVSQNTHNKKKSGSGDLQLKLKKIAKRHLKTKEKAKLHVYRSKAIAKKKGYYNDRKIRIRFFPQKKKARKLISLHDDLKNGYKLKLKNVKTMAA